MPERLIPIARKQHDSITNILATITAAQEQLKTVASVLLMGIEEDLGEVGIVGARCVDGVYSLVVEIPTPAQDTTT